MKVLMFGWEFPPHISGGLGTACYGITKGLSSFNDIELTFVIPKAYGDEESEHINLISASDIEISHDILIRNKKYLKLHTRLFDKDVSAYISPEQYKKLLLERKEKLKQSITSNPSGKIELTGKYDSNLYYEIERYGIVASEIAKRTNHDVIHAHDWLTFTAGIQAKKISGKPLVIHVHATEFDRCGQNYNPTVFHLEKKGMEKADKIIAVSNLTRNIIIEKYGINPKKVVTIHNAVESMNYQPNSTESHKGTNDKIVTFLGRVTSQKGPEYFICAAEKVLQKMDNVRFVMAGSGDLMQKMIKMVARMRISDKFHFTGFLKGNDVQRMYAISDLYIMPSVSEPFGIAPLEALQNNVPVIISKQSGVSEVINHAIKIDFWDTEGLADAIYGVLNYNGLYKMMKTEGNNEVRNLKWTDTAFKIRDLYNQILYKSVG